MCLNCKLFVSAKNLKEIVDSVQEDLVKKLEEIQAEQKAKEAAAVENLIQPVMITILDKER